MEQLYLWKDARLETQPANETAALPQADAPIGTTDELDELVCPELVNDDVASLEYVVGGPPVAVPLEAAVTAGVFGWTTDGPFTPDEEEVEALTGEHANEMIVLLSDLHAVEDALRFGYDPTTRRSPTTSEKRDTLLQSLQKERQRLFQSYADAVNVYAEAFGEAAAADLDGWVHTTVTTGDPQKLPYSPSHPWHYYHAGDNAPPVPVDQIPADEDAGRYIESDLPKNPAKRLAKLREWLAREREQLEADKVRYADIVERGADALSRYDREIAYTSDAMARAGSLALKYRHVSLALGRLRWIEDELKKLGAGELFGPV